MHLYFRASVTAVSSTLHDLFIFDGQTADQLPEASIDRARPLRSINDYDCCFLTHIYATSMSPGILTAAEMPTAPKSAIIVPLYLYPVDSATWQPLHQA